MGVPVGQYWLIIKKMEKILLILREILRYVENLYDVSKNFDMSEKFLDP
jgi:hypothetical protein